VHQLLQAFDVRPPPDARQQANGSRNSIGCFPPYLAVRWPDDVLWRVVRDDLPLLGDVCREQLAKEQAAERYTSNCNGVVQWPYILTKSAGSFCGMLFFSLPPNS
jgi:hypothetical protein